MGFHDSFFSGASNKLNFEPEEFHSDSFSVDSFIQRKRQTVPLDVLRDDLGSHLKCLRSSLIELINQDYGQFVNLSSNLVGLDGRIQSIVGPLTRTRKDLQGYDELLDANISSLSSQLERRRSIREGKARLQYLRMSSTALESSEKLIQKVPLEIVSQTDFSMLRSVCDEVAEAKFLLQCCGSSKLQGQLLSRWNVICNSVLGRINALLKVYADIAIGVVKGEEVDKSSSFQEDSKTIIKSLLYMYTELQCEPIVEEVLVKEVLLPKCEIVLSKKGNIGALFDTIETFLAQSPLISVWGMLQEFPWMAKYDFIGRGIFPCVLNILSKHFPHIWSPSNPETFHSNWNRCDKFISTLENKMPSLDHLQQFRLSDAMQDFNSKWQFPVYFQLRFHTIATELESALDDVTEPCSTTDFKLDATRVMIKVINQCWDKDKVYISRISGRFLKASALIVSRYIQEIEQKIASNKTPSLLHLSINAYCDLNLAELVVRQILLGQMVPELFSFSSDDGETVNNKEDKDSNLQTQQEQQLCSNNAAQFLSEFSWSRAKGAIETNLVEITVGQSLNSISSVNDLPRLFRRTNRDTPVKPLEYVDAILLPVSTLKNDIYNSHQKDLWEKIGDQIGNQILKRYQAQVQEVLVSVQRMEESLRRLKKVKGQNQQAPSIDSGKGLTDDDKIRLQIQLDVNYFEQKLKETSPNVDTSGIQSLFGALNGK